MIQNQKFLYSLVDKLFIDIIEQFKQMLLCILCNEEFLEKSQFTLYRVFQFFFMIYAVCLSNFFIELFYFLNRSQGIQSIITNHQIHLKNKEMTKIFVLALAILAIMVSARKNKTGNLNEITGNYNRAKGNENQIIGNYNGVKGDYNVIMGQYNSIKGTDSIAVGRGNKLKGYNNIVDGNRNHVNGQQNVAFGHRNRVKGGQNQVNGNDNKVDGNGNYIQ